MYATAHRVHGVSGPLRLMSRRIILLLLLVLLFGVVLCQATTLSRNKNIAHNIRQSVIHQARKERKTCGNNNHNKNAFNIFCVARIE